MTVSGGDDGGEGRRRGGEVTKEKDESLIHFSVQYGTRLFVSGHKFNCEVFYPLCHTSARYISQSQICF